MLNQIIFFILTNFILIISLIFAVLIIFFRKNLTKKTILIFFVITFVVFALFNGFLAFSQYNIWKESSVMKYALPPHSNINYFLSYIYHSFLKQILWRIISSVLILIIALGLNKLFKSSLFYDEEFYLLTYLGFLIDFPFGLFIFPLGLLILMFAHLIKIQKSQKINQLAQKTTSDFSHSLSLKLSLKTYWAYISILIIIINIALKYYGEIYKFQP